MNENPKIELLVSQNSMTINDLAEFWVGVKLTNQSGESIAFDVSGLALFVNGERSISWDLAVQNGTTINLKIGPYHSEFLRWPLGEALFEAAGTYELRLGWESFSSNKTVIISS